MRRLITKKTRGKKRNSTEDENKRYDGPKG